MKKLLIALAVTLLCAEVAHADVLMAKFFTQTAISTSNGNTINVTIPGKKGLRVTLWSIIAKSDLETSEIGILKGFGDSYVLEAAVEVGIRTRVYNVYESPVFCGQIGASYRLSLTSTTANSLIVNYTYE